MSIADTIIKPLYILSEQRHDLRGSRLRDGLLWTMARLSRSQAKAARRIFDAAPLTPAYLPIEQLPALLDRYQQNPRRWDKRAPADKVAGRAVEVLKSVRDHLPTSLSSARVLELACGDGRVALHLSRHVRSVTGIDLSDENFSPDAKAHVPIKLEDARQLSAESGSVDLIYAFDAFEHFSDPAAVLNEAHRVLAPGGVLFASFGPLWNSAFGPHQWGRIDVPYLHHLFRAPDLDDFADRTHRRRLTPNVNRLPLAYFRRLFTSPKFTPVSCNEKMNVSFVDLIAQHPSCFRSKVADFDELCVRSIEVVLKKRR